MRVLKSDGDSHSGNEQSRKTRDEGEDCDRGIALQVVGDERSARDSEEYEAETGESELSTNSECCENCHRVEIEEVFVRLRNDSSSVVDL